MMAHHRHSSSGARVSARYVWNRGFDGMRTALSLTLGAAILAQAAAALAQAPASTAPAVAPPPAAATTAAATPPKPAQITPASQAPQGAVSTYKISPGDSIDIYVWGDERLSRTLTVLPDGTFSFPLAGTVKASGHSSTEIEAELSRLLAGQYKGIPPQVTVSVRQATGMQISVIGKVHSPGTFTPSRYLTVLDALALSGGPSDFADVGNIIILRNTNGKVEAIRAKLGGVLKGKPNTDELGSLPQLIAGDTVVVP